MSENIKGRVYDIQGYSVHDGPGIRTTVFLMGCPLTCLWCHSPESQNYDFQLSWFDMRCIGTVKCGLCINVCPNSALYEREPEKSLIDNSTITKINIDRSKCDNCLACTKVCPANALVPSGYDISLEDVFKRIIKDKKYYGKDGGVTISGGEPMEQFEFTYAIAKRCKESNLTVCVDTTGFAPGENYEKILPYVDLFLFDLKHMDPKRSRNFVGVDNELILENAKLIAKNGGKLQIRIPTIPKLNASMENMMKTADFCKDLGDAVTMIQLLPYHNMGTTKYLRIGLNYKLVNVDPPSDEEMQSYLDLMLSYDLPAQIH
ncbi:glycyl-radical enzyme activating protein [Alkalibaculum sporogenes]|nr:glycyl-radical enzyme activating protein [Alkalibaculum sporogenes]